MMHTKIFPKIIKTLLFFSFLASSSFASATSSFNIALNFTGGLSNSQQTIVSQAADFWNNIITGYDSAISSSFTGFTVSVRAINLGGVGGTLAQASTSATSGPLAGGYTVSTGGSISFDINDIGSMETNGALLGAAMHEVGHIIGLGTLWSANNLYNFGSGEYTGAFGLAAYQSEFDAFATFVPVELEGGSGTANGHWNENNHGSGLTGISDSNGNDMRNELMTGWLNTPTFVSDTTIASLSDLGYTVSAVPLPGAVWLFSLGLSLLGFKFKKKG